MIVLFQDLEAFGELAVNHPSSRVMNLGIETLVGQNRRREVVEYIDNANREPPGVLTTRISNVEIVLEIYRGVA